MISKARKWQGDDVFVKWLVQAKYARMDGRKLVPCLSEPQYIYMWEAFRAGRNKQRGRMELNHG